jgi:hypothetical protein
MRKCLVSGWFSFEEMGATAGDLIAKDLVCDWLARAGRAFDVAYASPFAGGVDWRAVRPSDYDAVVFVCGPFGNGEPVAPFLEKFSGRPLFGVNLTMLDRLENWDPFARLWERDSDRAVRPDVTYLAGESRRVPVVGVILIHPQEEYGPRDRHVEAHAAIRRVLEARESAAVPIDTRLDENTTGLRTPAEVESLIARMDMVVTTRLHGLVLALKNGVPALAVDPIDGGAKVTRQARVVDWPFLHAVDSLDHRELLRDFDDCLTGGTRARARACRDRAVDMLKAVPQEFADTLARLG